MITTIIPKNGFTRDENDKDDNLVVTFPKLGRFKANNVRYVCNAQRLCE